MGWVFGNVIRYHRRDAIQALRASFPEKTDEEIRQLVRRMYEHLGMNFMELCRLVSRADEDPRDRVQFIGLEHVDAARARGNGVLLLSAHLGNWELVCAAAPPAARPLSIIAKNFRSAAFTEFWARARERYEVRALPARNSYRACLKALKRNEVIGFMLDQNMIITEGIFVEFFGRLACTTPGLAYLSAHARAPVVPVFMVREEGGRHRCEFQPMIEPPPDRQPETIRGYTQRYTGIIESAIRRHPEQWIWIHRRWKTQPRGERNTPALSEVLPENAM